MNKTVLQVLHFLSRFLLVACIAVVLVACGGASSETPPGGNNEESPSIEVPPDGTNDGNNQAPPTIEFPPEALVINLGPDLVLDDYCGEVLLSAGRTTATSLLWEQVGNGPRVRNLTNTDRFQVKFSPAIFSSNSSDSRKTTLRLTGWDDQGNMASDEITITFLPTSLPNPICNTPPTIEQIPNEIVQPGDTVVLTAIASDAEDGIAQIQIEWRETTVEPLVLGNSVSTGSILSFTAPLTPATISFEVTAIDSDGATESTEVVVQVIENNSPNLPNLPPVANAGADQFLRPGDTVNLLSSGSVDSDGNIVSYLWTQISGTPTVNFNSNSANPSFTAPDISGDLTFELTVTDNDGVEGRDTVVIHIASNVPPTADAGGDLSVNSGDTAPVSITGSGDDSDGNITVYFWTHVSGPPVTLIGANTTTVSFDVPIVQQQSIITLRLTVVDDGGASGSDEVRITVNAPLANIPPVANAGVDQIVNTGDLVTLSGLGADPDGDPLTLTYSWRQTNGSGIELTNASMPVTMFTAPQVTAVTDITFELTVTDDNGATGMDQVIVTVVPLNIPPTVDVGADFTALSGNQVTITGGASDQDGQIVQYTWTRISGPSVTLNDTNTATVNFIAPAVNQSTQLRLRLTVVDNQGATASDDVFVTINPGAGGNSAPVVNAGPDISAVSGDNVSITGIVSDDGEIITYIWTQLTGSPSLTLDTPTTPTVSFVAPNVGSVTAFTLRLTAVDDVAAIGFDEVVVTVTPVTGSANSAPTANAGSNRVVTAGETVSITGSGNDIDGSVANYQWTQRNGINVVLNNAETSTVSFDAPSVATTSDITLRLTVTDNLGASGIDDVVITINPEVVNIAPAANAGADVTVDAGQLVTLTGSGDDPGGAIANYAWSQVGGEPIILSNITNAILQFTAPSVQQLTTATLRLTVTDNLGATGFDDVIITINPAVVGNQAPVANAGPDQSVNSQDFVALTGNASDVDGTITSFQWAQTAGSPVTLSNGNTANASFGAPQISAATGLEFEFTVTDDAGATHSDAVLVTVYPFTQLSGTITTQDGTQVDSDVNDPSAASANNNTPGEAQPLFNPVILGGYVNRPGTGAPGRSQADGDIDDYFSISLSANQVINLYIGDANTSNDLDLVLWDEAGTTLIDSSASPTAAVESLVVPSTGNYLINVRAVGGASNYVLSVGVSNLSTQSNGWRLSDDFETGNVIVRFKDNVGIASVNETLNTRAASVGLQAKAGAPRRNMLLGLGNASQKTAAFATLGVTNAPAIVSSPLQDKWETLQAAKALVKRTDVAEAGLNYRYYPTAVPNDTNYSLQWHYPLINLPQAWDITTGNSNVIVAVIDTGVLLNHPDLQGQLVPGYDFIASNSNSGDGEPGIDANPDDPGDGGGGSSSFHGTHVAGTIAAASNNGAGVAGIAWGVKIMPCRAVGINGGLRYDIEQCVRYVSGLSNDSGTVPAQPADVINLSLGGPSNTTSAPTAYRLARDAGVVVVAAAGNDASSGLFAPAAYDGVVSVSATNISRQLASYSNFGSTIDVSAPGGDSGDINGDGFFDGVLSTGGDDSNGPIVFNYRFAAGTSMASPHMAGVVALMKSVYPDLTPAILDTMLQNGELTDDLGATGRDNNFGYGLINAQKAVLAASNAGTPTPPPLPAAVLQVSPTSLNLGVALTSAQINIANAGGGTLDITNINNDSSGWLSVSPSTVDANGLGTYNVNTNRNGLLDGVYTATITITSSAGTQTVSATMQVNTAATSDNAGFHYIELIDMETMQLFDRVISSGTNGVYEFTFPSVPLGVYHIQAGSDLDKDGVLCETGDACGAYPTQDIVSQHVNVDGSTTSLNGLDFTTGFSVNLAVP